MDQYKWEEIFVFRQFSIYLLSLKDSLGLVVALIHVLHFYSSISIDQKLILLPFTLYSLFKESYHQNSCYIGD